MLNSIKNYDQFSKDVSSNYSFLLEEEKNTTAFNLNRIEATQGLFSQFSKEEDSDLIDVTKQEFGFYPAAFFVKRMLDYERKYGIPSSTFYRLYSGGYFERSRDFTEWAIIFKNLIVDQKNKNVSE